MAMFVSGCIIQQCLYIVSSDVMFVIFGVASELLPLSHQSTTLKISLLDQWKQTAMIIEEHICNEEDGVIDVICHM